MITLVLPTLSIQDKGTNLHPCASFKLSQYCFSTLLYILYAKKSIILKYQTAVSINNISVIVI